MEMLWRLLEVVKLPVNYCEALNEIAYLALHVDGTSLSLLIYLFVPIVVV